jgi:potassium channel subfamily K
VLDEHHYRHVLIAQIRRVYADTASATPKQYTYDEWAYFLKLLGEDESDAKYHRHAAETRGGEASSSSMPTSSSKEGEGEVAEIEPETETKGEASTSSSTSTNSNSKPNSKPTSSHNSHGKVVDTAGQEAAFSSAEKNPKGEKGDLTRWSWIGERSPLMGDKEEAEWLLEKFLQRLEESLRGEGKEKEEGVKGETERYHWGEGKEGKEGTGDREGGGNTGGKNGKDEDKDKDKNQNQDKALPNGRQEGK